MVNPFGVDQDHVSKKDNGYLPNLMTEEDVASAGQNTESEHSGESQYLSQLLDDSDASGIANYKKAMEFLSQRNYDDSEVYLKKSLKDIKANKQETSAVYLHVLNRLALVNSLNNKMGDAEKYYKICTDMVKNVPGVEDLGYEYFNSLLHFYIKSDLDKAEKLAKDMVDIEFKAYNIKKIRFSIANIWLFKREYENAMQNYQKVLKMIPDEQLKAYTLNNMAVTGVHQVDRANREGQSLAMTAEDHREIVCTFKESISLLENLPEHKARGRENKSLSSLEQDSLKELLDTKTVIPEDYTQDHESRYLGLITNKDSGKVITNISEYLLTHENSNPVNISLWFKIGLDLYENTAPQLMDRHLVLLGLFYAANQQIGTAEKLYKASLQKMDKDVSYTKAMAMNMYGRMLIKHPKLEQQGTYYLKQSEELMKILPHWYDKIESTFLFDDKV